MRSLLVVAVVVASTLSLSSPATAQSDAAEIVMGLRSSDVGERIEAAEQLDEHPPTDVLPALHLAARIETDTDALIPMLLALGSTGMPDALSVLQTHARSPIRALRHAGREGLRRWLVAHGHLRTDDDMPEPPHRFYQRPQHELTAKGAFPYHPPPFPPPEPSGIPKGMKVRATPRWGLIGTGLGVFLGTYTAAVSTALMANNDASDHLQIPVVGSFISAAKHVDRKGEIGDLGPILGAAAVFGGITQAAGLTLFIVGAATEEKRLERTPLSLQASPTGLTLSGSF